MIAIVWRYRVRQECRRQFEQVYGTDGDWAVLFARAEAYLGTELLRGEEGDYMTLDRWRSAGDFDSFLAAHRTDYEALDRRTEGWTSSEERIGLFSIDEDGPDSA